MNEWESQKNVLDKFQEKNAATRRGMYGWLEMWLLRATTTFIIRCRQRARVCVCMSMCAGNTSWLNWLFMVCAVHHFFALCKWKMLHHFFVQCVHGIHSRWQFILFYSAFLSFAIFIEIGLKNPAKSFIEHKLCTEWIYHCHKSQLRECVSSFPLFLIRIRASGLFPIYSAHSFAFPFLFKKPQTVKISRMNYCDYATKMMFLLKAFAYFLARVFLCVRQRRKQCLTAKQMVITKPTDILVSIRVSVAIVAVAVVVFSLFGVFSPLPFPSISFSVSGKTTARTDPQNR